MQVLVINCGSSSVKYKVFKGEECVLSDKIERLGESLSHHDAIGQVLDAVKDYPINAVGHRVVHGAAGQTRQRQPQAASAGSIAALLFWSNRQTRRRSDHRLVPKLSGN